MNRFVTYALVAVLGAAGGAALNASGLGPRIFGIQTASAQTTGGQQQGQTNQRTAPGGIPGMPGGAPIRINR